MSPDVDAPKSEWRAWARTLPPVADEVAHRVAGHLRSTLATIDGPVLGYEALPDEVTVDVRIDGVAALDERRRLTIGDLDVDAIAAVLVPARVFDREGYRLGRGGGHYDRLLPRLRAGVPTIGVTCASRLVDRLPREPHDVPMTHLATETGVHPMNSTREQSESERHFVENEDGPELDS